MTGNRGLAGLLSGGPQQGVHPRIVVPHWVPDLICQEVRWIPRTLCGLPSVERGHHQELIPTAPSQENTNEISPGAYIH